MEQQNIIVEKTIEFSLAIMSFCLRLEEDKKYIIARQLMKAGTSIGANVWEAQHAESRSDLFIK